MSDTTPDQPAGEDDLRRHAETPAEGPADAGEPDDSADELRQHAESPPEGSD